MEHDTPTRRDLAELAAKEAVQALQSLMVERKLAGYPASSLAALAAVLDQAQQVYRTLRRHPAPAFR